MALKLYISEAKGLKLKVRTFSGLIPSFRLDKGEKPFDVEQSSYLPPELRWNFFKKLFIQKVFLTLHKQSL